VRRSTWACEGTGTAVQNGVLTQLSVGGYPERSTAMIAFPLALVIVQITAVASAIRLPMNQCRITLDNYRFDLCPLLDERHNSGHVDLVLHYQTPPTITTIVYNISLNGPLRSSDAFSDDEQVGQAAANCGVQFIQFHFFSVSAGPGLA
jgi:hypothetical protein